MWNKRWEENREKKLKQLAKIESQRGRKGIYRKSEYKKGNEKYKEKKRQKKEKEREGQMHELKDKGRGMKSINKRWINR